MIKPEVFELLKLSQARRNLARELVVRQVDQLELRKVGNGTRNLAGKGVRREVDVLQTQREVTGDSAGEMVLRDIKNLKTGEVSDLRRKSPREGVVLQKHGAKERTFTKRRRNGPVEGVGAKAQLPQHAQVRKTGSEAATELKARQAQLGDSVVVASNSAPVARSGRRGRIPAV